MPAIPNAIERAAIGFGLFPPFLVEVINAAGFRAFGVAARLGVFEQLRQGPATTTWLAARCGADPLSLTRLLDLLWRTGYLRKSGNRYGNSRFVERWLLDGGPGLPNFALHWHNVLYQHFDTLEEAIRVGAPRPHLHEWLSAGGHWPVFNAAMAELATQSADAIARAAAMPASVRRLADLGGSHGLNAAAFCRRHPQLRATILDLPAALGLGERKIAEMGLSDRVAFRAADITRDDLGGPYDAVLLFQLVHYFSPEQNTSLLQRVREALTAGGRVIVFDQLRGSAPLPLATAFFSLLALTYRVGLGGDVYSYEEIGGWLRDAGFREIRKRSIRAAPGHGLITAMR
jgi:O-methyltransferase